MRFISKALGLRVTLRGAYHSEVNGVRTFFPALQAKFNDGIFETEDQELIDGLLACPVFGVEFWAEGKNVDNPAAIKLKAEEEAANETIVTACPQCSFNAKTHPGLLAHMRAKHPVEQ